jgi:hypothetical protein
MVVWHVGVIGDELRLLVWVIIRNLLRNSVYGGRGV